ncbi:hypothetical protein ABLE91_05890 [Aquabacter sp. CN5-332]|uniref:hypothetical protein n=1 Tax=Aquabacter sp. CN5-332 TaxID=3156608 RepID=UPI0032B5C8ED
MIPRTIVWLVAGATGAYLCSLVIDREPPVIVTDSRLITPQVEPGGTLKVEVEIFRTRRCETSIDRFIFDSQGGRHILEPLELRSAGGARGEERYTNLIPVPLDAAPGPARYRSSATYRCNPLHRLSPITAEPREVQFEIMPPGIAQPNARN